MSKTKIVVFKLKELLLTAALVVLGIATLLTVIALISIDKEETPTLENPSGLSNASSVSAAYYPGVYTTTMKMNDTSIHLELVCDANHITSVRLINLDEAVATMYPLLTPALEELELQLSRDVSLEELEFTEGSTYTQTFLVEAIEQVLAKASISR